MTTPGPGPSRPPGRYDDGRRRPRPLVVAAVVVVVAAFGSWVLWAGLGAATPDVRSDVLGFKASSPGSVRASIEVSADKARSVTCTIQAQDHNHEVVGVTRTTLPPGADPTRDANVVVRTRALAVTVVIVGCLLGPGTG
jgi:Domain of unknown function (DUF4307)